MGALLLAVGLATVSRPYVSRLTARAPSTLTVLPQGNLKLFEEAFDAGADSTRVVALLSPT